MAKAKNQKEFNDLIIKKIKQKISSAVQETGTKIYEVIDEHIEDYYNEPVFGEKDPETGEILSFSSTPIAYARTGSFQEALTDPTVSVNGNKITAKVAFDDEYLRHEYPGYTGTEKSLISGNFKATGLDVVKWANEELHGGTVSGNIRFWDDAIEELGGTKGIKNLLIKNIKSKGLKFKK